MVNEEKKWTLTFDPNDYSVWCSCRHFESIGILCCHALKIYEANEVRKLPEKYILKRWTKDARDGVIHDTKGSEIQVDPKLKTTQTYRQLCHMMISLAAEMSNCPETSAFIHNSIIQLHKEARDFRSRLRNSNDDDNKEEDGSKEKGGNQENKKMDGLKDKQPKGIKKRQGTKRWKRFKSWPDRLAKKSRSQAKVRTEESDAPISCSAPIPTTLQAPPQVESFTSMMMAPLDCPTPSLEAFEEEFLLSGEGQSSITASSMSNQFLVGESAMCNQHEGFGNQHLL